MENTLTTREVADHFHITLRTVYRWIDDGKLKPVKVGRFLLFYERDVLALEAPADTPKSDNWE